MIAFPSMLVSAAEKAGMAVPKNPDKFEEEKDSFPHFFIYCMVQLARPVRWGEHWENAKVIAEIPADKLMTMTLTDFMAAGLEYHSSRSYS